MSEQKNITNETGNRSDWTGIYKGAAISSFLVVLLYLFQMIFIKNSNYPINIEQWYELVSGSRLQGLLYLNTLDIITALLLGIVFVALCVRLRPESRPLTTLALPFAFLGIGTFIIPRMQLLSVLTLSTEHVSAANTQSAEAIIYAGKALEVLAVPTLQTTGFFIISAAAFLLSIIMINSERMPKIGGFIGIMAFLLTIAESISVMFIPDIVYPMMIVAGAFWIVWWAVIGVGLISAKD
ncbi:MAG: DUF4386 family protein [Clostridia bacterium]|nr:DUF4386 family protein [Clostridia bacterium]